MFQAILTIIACHRLRSTGFYPFSVQQLALCCSYQAGPVSRIWCVCSSTGFPFHRGFSSSCARWCTGVFTTRRRYTYEISACLSRLLGVVLTSDQPQLETFAFHRQRLWQSAGVDFLLPVLRLGTIYPLLWKTIGYINFHALLSRSYSKLNFLSRCNQLQCAFAAFMFERRITYDISLLMI